MKHTKARVPYRTATKSTLIVYLNRHANYITPATWPSITELYL